MTETRVEFDFLPKLWLGTMWDPASSAVPTRLSPVEIRGVSPAIDETHMPAVIAPEFKSPIPAFYVGIIDNYRGNSTFATTHQRGKMGGGLFIPALIVSPQRQVSPPLFLASPPSMRSFPIWLDVRMVQIQIIFDAMASSGCETTRPTDVATQKSRIIAVSARRTPSNVGL